MEMEKKTIEEKNVGEIEGVKKEIYEANFSGISSCHSTPSLCSSSSTSSNSTEEEKYEILISLILYLVSSQTGYLIEYGGSKKMTCLFGSLELKKRFVKPSRYFEFRIERKWS